MHLNLMVIAVMSGDCSDRMMPTEKCGCGAVKDLQSKLRGVYRS